MQLIQVVLYIASEKDNAPLALHMSERFLKQYAGHFHPQNDTGGMPELTKKSLSSLHSLMLASGCQGIHNFLTAANAKDWEMSRQECDDLLVSLL